MSCRNMIWIALFAYILNAGVIPVTSRIGDWFCDLPAFPGHPAPSCDPNDSHCCSGLYCVVDPTDPAGVLHICQDYQSARFPSVQQIKNDSLSEDNLKVAALLSLKASDQASEIINNLKRSYQIIVEEIYESSEFSVRTYSDNIDVLGKAAIISAQNERRTYKKNIHVDEINDEDKFDWSSIAPKKENEQESNLSQNTKSISNSGYHRGYISNKVDFQEDSLDSSPKIGQNQEIGKLLEEASMDLQQATKIMRDKVLSDSNNIEKSTISIAQSQMIETAHGLVASALQLIQKTSANFPKPSGSDASVSEKNPTESPAHNHVSSHPPNGKEKSPRITEIHMTTINALDSAELAAEALACADPSSKDREEHCKNAQNSVKLVKAAIQVINSATALEFDWNQFTPKGINTGDRSAGTLDGPCGKTSSDDFGKCQRGLECVGLTNFAPGKCKESVTKKQKLEKAINLALDAADSANVFANQVRSAVGQIQVSLTNNDKVMRVLKNQEKTAGSKDANSNMNDPTSSPGRIVLIVASTTIFILIAYAVYNSTRNFNREKYEPI